MHHFWLLAVLAYRVRLSPAGLCTDISCSEVDGACWTVANIYITDPSESPSSHARCITLRVSLWLRRDGCDLSKHVAASSFALEYISYLQQQSGTVISSIALPLATCVVFYSKFNTTRLFVGPRHRTVYRMPHW